MSFDGQRWVYAVMVSQPDLPHAALRIALVLGNAHNQKTGKCIPRQQFIAGEIGRSRRTVRGKGGLIPLKRRGLIEVYRRYDENGYRDADAYVLRPVGDVAPRPWKPERDATKGKKPSPRSDDEPTGNLTAIGQGGLGESLGELRGRSVQAYRKQGRPEPGKNPEESGNREKTGDGRAGAHAANARPGLGRGDGGDQVSHHRPPLPAQPDTKTIGGTGSPRSEGQNVPVRETGRERLVRDRERLVGDLTKLADYSESGRGTKEYRRDLRQSCASRLRKLAESVPPGIPLPPGHDHPLPPAQALAGEASWDDEAPATDRTIPKPGTPAFMDALRAAQKEKS